MNREVSRQLGFAEFPVVNLPLKSGLANKLPEPAFTFNTHRMR